MANIYRVQLLLNLDDPIDNAIRQALEPMLKVRRANAFMRQAIARELGLIAGSNGSAGANSNSYKAVRPSPTLQIPASVALDTDAPDDQDTVESAASNFMSMFG